MGIVAAVYTKTYYQEFILPPLNNSDFRIPVNKEAFGLKEPVSVRFEIIDDQWRLCPDSEYKLFSQTSGEVKKPADLAGGEVFRLITKAREQLTILIRARDTSFQSYAKYSLDGVTSITVGRKADNIICYGFQGLISGYHAVLHRKKEGWKIRNLGTNGLYLNAGLVKDEAELHFGDDINIIGLHMVFLGNVLAIDESDSAVKVNQDTLKHMSGEKTGEEKAPAEGGEEGGELSGPAAASKILFHRSPRNIGKLETDEIEIEAPPALQKKKQQPLLMTIGPSFTMALPMLLGCLLMVFSSRTSGISSGAFLYSGLVMSMSSGVVGVFWALTNLRYQKKEEKEEEDHRFEAYGQYLVEKTEEVRKKYENNKNVLLATYPEAKECASYRESSPELWNRNRRHDDFLSCRLGLGDIPFQVQVKVPKKKFTLTPDPLAQKPDLIVENYSTLYQVPVLADLLRHEIVGIAGGADREGADAVARVLLTQIAACHCYTDVKIALLSDEEGEGSQGKWDYVRWYPHVWASDKKIRYFASNKSEVSDVCYELTKIFRQRKEEGKDSKEETLGPHIILVITDLSLIEGELISKYVFDQDQTLGLTTLILSDSVEHLPNDCDYIIEHDSRFDGMYNVSAQKEDRVKIKFDEISVKEAEKQARRLSNLEVQEIETGGEIPSSLTFFDMYGVRKPQELNAPERWRKNRTYENIKGLIGQKAGGADCYLDVHEKYHGPHGLVAGTTGSGKSETLQTYILSLALNYSPDDVGFFLIDYKGGGMANLFSGLPHLVGSISNLSGNQVNRAMVSIKSENRRRQRIFNENGVNNINAYTRMVKNKEASEPVPHLFIVIDEFAELKKEEPDFMRELISVAQVGRSLGVHLILATQKPSGTVDDNIWSNSKFRLCLRVQDRQDSMDMLHKPDAAYITQAGRCYLQVGSDEVYELFQSGWSGAPYDESLEAGSADIAREISSTGRVSQTGGLLRQEKKNESAEKWLRTLAACVYEAAEKEESSLQDLVSSKSRLTDFAKDVFSVIAEHGIDYEAGRYNQARLEAFISLLVEVDGPSGADKENVIAMTGAPSGAGGVSADAVPESTIGNVMALAFRRMVRLPEQKEKTQLDAVIEYLQAEAKKNGFTRHHQLWMPPLPERLYLHEFPEFCSETFDGSRWKEQEGSFDLETVMGRFDDPANQAQIPLHVSFSEGGHLAVIGSVVTGKSTFLQTLLYGLTEKYSPDALNIYGIDFSSKMMSAFEEAPHVGGIAYEGDNERIDKLFHMLGEILDKRKKILRGGTYSQYVQVHGMEIPAILLVIDNFSAFNEKTSRKYEGDVQTLAKEGVSLGIYMAVSAAGFGMNELPGRIAENFRSQICLELPDKYAYADILHTMSIGVLPETGVKGRGLALCEGQVLEFQTALALDADDDYQRMERIAGAEREMADRWSGKTARKIPEIPEKPVWEEFRQLEDVKEAAISTDRMLPVGYDADSAQVYSIDLSRTFCYLITGMARTGKRNFMKVMVLSAKMRGADVYIIDNNGDMNTLTGLPDISLIGDMDDVYTFFRDVLTPEFVTRNKVKKELENSGAEEEEIFLAAAKEKEIFIFITDFAWFSSKVYSDSRNMSGFLETLISKGRLHNIYFVAILPLEMRSMISGYKMCSDFTGYQTGIHFGGDVAQNPLMNFNYLSYRQQSEVLKPGLGLLPSGTEENTARKIVVPLARWRKTQKP